MCNQSKNEKLSNIIKEGSVISKHKDTYNCLYEKEEFEEKLKSLPKTSSHQYTPEMIALIERFKNGLVLDCGAGSREVTYDNVVNVEIFPYASTDVVAAGSKLPFQDNSFDAVLSLAVLEHVEDPFSVANELQRVLKPGGLLWIDVAFMQPYHGYPHHYYNMTQNGLNRLLGENMTIVHSGPPRYGTPIWSLTWILTKYVNGLTNETRERFLNLRVSDLLTPASKHLNEDYVTMLAPETSEQLAATVSVLAQKSTT